MSAATSQFSILPARSGTDSCDMVNNLLFLAAQSHLADIQSRCPRGFCDTARHCASTGLTLDSSCGLFNLEHDKS
jgi:hypothetical protein